MPAGDGAVVHIVGALFPNSDIIPFPKWPVNLAQSTRQAGHVTACERVCRVALDSPGNRRRSSIDRGNSLARTRNTSASREPNLPAGRGPRSILLMQAKSQMMLLGRYVVWGMLFIGPVAKVQT